MAEILFNASFIIIYVFILFATMVLLPYAGISLRKFSIPSLFVIFYLVFAYVGIAPLYFGLDSYSRSLEVNDKTIIFSMLIYSGLSLLLVICGFIYAYRVLNLKSNKQHQRLLVGATSIERLGVGVLFVLCIGVFFAYVRNLDTIALFKALQGDFAGAALARSNMGNAFAGKYWRYHLFFRTLLDYCVIFFFADFVIRRNRTSKLLFLLALLAATFTATAAIEKGPLADLFIMLYLAYIVYQGGRYWQPAAKYVGIAMVAVLASFFVFFMGSSDIWSGLQSVLRRVFTGQITPAYFYLRMFPDYFGYLWGSSFPNPGGLLPFDVFLLTVRVAEVIFPNDIVRGVVGTAPTVFWAEMYANFGVAGITVSSFFVGILLFVVSYVLSRQSLSPVIIAATVSLAMHYRTLSATSLSNYFFDIPFVTIVIVTVLLLYAGKKGHRSISYNNGMLARTGRGYYAK